MRLFKEPGAVQDSAGRIDKAADPGIGGADKGTPGFHRPEQSLGEMLVRPRCAAEPGIVGDVEDDVGPGSVSQNLARKDRLVADRRSRRRQPWDRQRGALGTRLEAARD